MTSNIQRMQSSAFQRVACLQAPCKPSWCSTGWMPSGSCWHAAAIAICCASSSGVCRTCTDTFVVLPTPSSTRTVLLTHGKVAAGMGMEVLTSTANAGT